MTARPEWRSLNPWRVGGPPRVRIPQFWVHWNVHLQNGVRILPEHIQHSYATKNVVAIWWWQWECKQKKGLNHELQILAVVYAIRDTNQTAEITADLLLGAVSRTGYGRFRPRCRSALQTSFHKPVQSRGRSWNRTAFKNIFSACGPCFWS